MTMDQVLITKRMSCYSVTTNKAVVFSIIAHAYQIK